MSGEVTLPPTSSNRVKAGARSGLRGEITVRSAADLADLRAGRLHPRPGGLRLELSRLDADAAAPLATRIGALRNECGCAMGLRLSTPVFLMVVIWQLAGGPHGPRGPIGRMGLSLVVVLIAAGLGKLLGIARARAAMRREIDRLAAALEASEPAAELFHVK